MKQLDCLVPGCPWHTQGTDEAELVRRGAEHLREVHGETEIRPEMVTRLKERIHEADDAAAS